MAEVEQDVVIVGGGIAGLATAVGLKRVGVKCLVLERSHELRATGAALGLSPNALRALDVLGVVHKLTSIYNPLESARVMNLVSGVTQQVSFTGRSDGKLSEKFGMGTRVVHRKKLLEALAEELDPGTIRLSSKLSSIKSEVLEDSSTVTLLRLEDGASIRAKVVIGCDGVHSAVAQWLGLSAPIDSGRSAVRGLAVFPEGHGFKSGGQVFLEHGKRTGFAPINDKEVYWFTIHNTTTREKEMAKGGTEQIQKEVLETHAHFPADFLEVVRHADLSTISWAPLMLRVPWNIIMGQNHKSNVTVVGDAMHPMTPDLGQGGCTALEDAVVLVRNIGRALVQGGSNSGKRVEEGMDRYVKERRWRVASITAASYFSGWVQEGGSGLLGWAVRCFRDYAFYKFLFARIRAAMNLNEFDCGDLVMDQ